MLDNPKKALVSVRDVKMHFPIHTGVLRRKTGAVKAVDGITFDIMEGETLGLVGESGCGKSTAGRAVLRLYDITSGEITMDGIEIGSTPQSQLREMRPMMQMVFQDPQASLNPRMTVEAIIREPLDEHTTLTAQEKREKVAELMDAVGLNRAFAKRYPQAFSGGQRQRIGIARALASRPDLIICDEPVSALDVSVQAQILNMLIDLRNQLNLTYLFISHDLAVVEYICDRIIVMYLGKIIESADYVTLYKDPKHPYTQGLLRSVPRLDRPEDTDLHAIPGNPPNLLSLPEGCKFRDRCPQAFDKCSENPPMQVDEERHAYRCFLPLVSGEPE